MSELENSYNNDCDRLQTFYASFPPFYNGWDMRKVQAEAQKKLDAEYEAKGFSLQQVGDGA